MHLKKCDVTAVQYKKKKLNALFMLMQPCDKEFFRMQPRHIFLLSALYQTELGKFFFVFQYMELSVPECEEEGLFYCDCTQYTGVSECY